MTKTVAQIQGIIEAKLYCAILEITQRKSRLENNPIEHNPHAWESMAKSASNMRRMMKEIERISKEAAQIERKEKGWQEAA